MAKPLSLEIVQERVNKRWGRGEYDILGPYVDTKTKTWAQHNACGAKFEVRPNDIMRSKNGCPNCRKSVKKVHQQFVQDVYVRVGLEYTVMSEYVNNKTAVMMLHVTCGRTFEVVPDQFLRKKDARRCTHCRNCFKRTDDDFDKDIYGLVQDEYLAWGLYNGSKKPILMEHTICGKQFYILPHNFKNGTRCTYCNSSKPAKIAWNYLHDNQYQFAPEYALQDCKYKNILHFDFAVFRDFELVCLIELDGRQHYDAKAYRGGEAQFVEQQKRDAIKNEYCEDNNIKLIRIKYDQFDKLEHVLEESLAWVKINNE